MERLPSYSEKSTETLYQIRKKNKTQDIEQKVDFFYKEVEKRFQKDAKELIIKNKTDYMILRLSSSDKETIAYYNDIVKKIVKLFKINYPGFFFKSVYNYNYYTLYAGTDLSLIDKIRYYV